MSQSLANIVVHLVFSTKSRRPLLRDEERGQLHAYARRTTDHWMNDMRGIEVGGVCLVGFVWPLQGRRELFGNVYLGLRASRFTPGCHISGFQPADLSAPKARELSA